MRRRSLAALAAAERHFTDNRDGLLILQMVGGLLDITFLPDVLAGGWELVLKPGGSPAEAPETVVASR